MMAGFILFTDTHSVWYRRIAGVVHGFSHLFSTFLIGWLAGYITFHYFGWQFDSWQQLLFSAISLLVLGTLVGSTIMGLYLFVSLNIFGRHANEAFSSLAIPDFKNFLRMRIEANGDLTIFPVGIKRVPRKWKRQPEGTPGPAYVPDGVFSGPELVERPIYFKSVPGAAPGTLNVIASAERALRKEDPNPMNTST
jgi:hypothetical protein